MRKLKNFKWLLILIISSLVFIPQFVSAQISVTNNQGVWDSPVSGFNLSGAGTSQLKWGGTVSQFRSGYGYVAQPVIFPVSLGQQFNLGTYTQSNRVIPIGGGLTAVAFDGSVSLNVDGTSVNGLNFTYNFLHDETPNISGQCPPGTSVCNDLNRITNNGSIAIPFVASGNNYLLTILGFKQNGNLLNQFSTPENQNTVLILDAIITTQVHLPEPATYILLTSTIGICYFIKRREAEAIV
jgi:hypothetical protein